jgi:predicted permease
LSDRLGNAPGVRAASFSVGAAPLQGEDDVFFWLEGGPKPASTSEMQMALVYRVEPGYLAAMGIPLKQGRFFTSDDEQNTAPVVVIDEVFVQKYFPDSDPLSKRIHIGDGEPLQVVGVVGHVKQWSIDSSNDRQSLQAQLYQPFRQLTWQFSNTGVVVRADESARDSLFASLRRVVQSQNSEIVIYDPQTLDEVIAESLSQHRFSMILLNSFALVALLLASIGLYGVISYLVGQRTREFGIRLALGAQRRDVLRLVVGEGLKMVLGGVGLGLVAAFGLTRLLSQMVFGVSTTDPLTFVALTAGLVGVALLASFVPARRATKVDPLKALRYE